MKILITGGSGFIGSNLLDYYLNLGESNLLSIDVKDPVKPQHYKFFKKCDILNFEELKVVFDDFSPDYVIHLAAKADLKGKDLEYYNANILGVKNVVLICKDLNCVKKIIFASTMLVCKVGYLPKNDLDFCPPNLYGESKVIGEKIVRDELNNIINWTIVRPTSIWGPGFNITYRSFFEYIYKKKYFNFSGKMSVKTYGYIENVTYQINQILLSEKSIQKVYYLGDYDSYSIKEWAKEIGEIFGNKITTIPRTLIYILAIFGDILGYFKINFPMTSFRYKNMTTNNKLLLENLKQIAPNLPFTRQEGNIKTIQWMKENGYIDNV